jgi:hypothetical protein
MRNSVQCHVVMGFNPSLRVYRVLSFFSSCRNWDSPTPLTLRRLCTPHPFVPGGEAQSLTGGGGRSQFLRGDRHCGSLDIYMYCICDPALLKILTDQPGAGVLDEPYSQLSPLSGVAAQARQSIGHRLEPCLSYVAWRAGMATPLSGLS